MALACFCPYSFNRTCVFELPQVDFELFSLPFARHYLREWRILYGHSFHNYDEATGASLASKVCEGTAFDRQWWENALINEIEAYLTPLFSAYLPSLSELHRHLFGIHIWHFHGENM